jgi:class 3 adenylate cyclase
LVAEYRAFYPVDVRDVLSSIRVPVVVTGAGHAEHFHENARLIADRVPTSRLVEVDGGGGGEFHWYGRAQGILNEFERLATALRDEQSTFDRVLATVLFTDIVGSTAKAAALGDAAWKDLIARHDALTRTEVERFRGTVIRTTGDGLLATFDGPARGVRCAQAIIEALRPLGLTVRAGLHTGEIELAGGDLAGVGVHIGARVGALAGDGEVWATSTVRDLVVGSGLVFEDAGQHELRGVPDAWRLYRLLPQ